MEKGECFAMVVWRLQAEISIHSIRLVDER
jgi:hypothetical protein